MCTLHSSPETPKEREDQAKQGLVNVEENSIPKAVEDL